MNRRMKPSIQSLMVVKSIEVAKKREKTTRLRSCSLHFLQRVLNQRNQYKTVSFCCRQLLSIWVDLCFCHRLDKRVQGRQHFLQRRELRCWSKRCLANFSVYIDINLETLLSMCVSVVISFLRWCREDFFVFGSWIYSFACLWTSNINRVKDEALVWLFRQHFPVEFIAFGHPFALLLSSFWSELSWRECLCKCRSILKSRKKW